MPKPTRYDHQTWTKHGDNADQSEGLNRSQVRRLAFKKQFAKKGLQKDWTNSIRAHLQEEDVDMGANNSYGGDGGGYRKSFYNNRRGGGGGGRKNSFIPRKMEKRKLLESPSNWYRVTLPFGNKYEKDFILVTLKNGLNPLPFIPFSWSVHGNSATFYIEEHKIAEKLYELDRQIECPDGFKLGIRVYSGSPNVDISPSTKEKMKSAMVGRYNAAAKALDLSRFHVDPHLQDVFCALFKPIVLLNVIDIIAENIPELQALKLDDNRIQVLSNVRKINSKLPNLKILHLGNNRIHNMSSLEALSGLPIVELVLDGNPLCNKFRDQTAYVSDVRNIFPKVIKLDGIDLDPPIGFDLTEDTPLPTSQQTFLCNPEGQSIVKDFLLQYFTVFDSESRQPLLQAYHENAIFSMSMCYPHGQNVRNSSCLNWYNTDNRNLFRVTDNDRRTKLLKQGKQAIIDFLGEMPMTKHDMNSFTVDLAWYMPFILMTVTGMFRELRTGQKNPPLRHFCRTLLIVPVGSGFCIANEQLLVSNATDEQAKTAFKLPGVTCPAPAQTTASPMAAPAHAAVSPIVPVVQAVSPEIKQQMVQAMAQQSGMNISWSQKCLEETNWDFNRAAMVFTDLHKQGTIPAEAFIK